MFWEEVDINWNSLHLVSVFGGIIINTERRNGSAPCLLDNSMLFTTDELTENQKQWCPHVVWWLRLCWPAFQLTSCRNHSRRAADVKAAVIVPLQMCSSVFEQRLTTSDSSQLKSLLMFAKQPETTQMLLLMRQHKLFQHCLRESSLEQVRQQWGVGCY